MAHMADVGKYCFTLAKVSHVNTGFQWTARNTRKVSLQICGEPFVKTT